MSITEAAKTKESSDRFRTVSQLREFKVISLDGDLGTVSDFYFDDQKWVVRYLVGKTGNWLVNRHVLISPHSIKNIDSLMKQISVSLSMKQIEESPALDNDAPISPEFEANYYRYFGYPNYWTGPYLWGPTSLAGAVALTDESAIDDSTKREQQIVNHLRKLSDMKGQHVQSTDGPIGHVVDFVLEDESWSIRYLVVDTRDWWPGRKVLISIAWIEEVNWDAPRVAVNLTRELIKLAPEYKEHVPITRAYEAELHDHYGKPDYWSGESPVTALVY